MPARADQDVVGKKLADAEEAGKLCGELEGEISALRVAFEQYFLGLERHPPTRKHEVFRKRMLELKTMFVRQTAVKFRIGSLAQKATTYERLWDRTLKEMENGTYRRDVFKARMHAKRRDRAKPEVAETHETEDLDLSDLDSDEDVNDPLTLALQEAAASVPSSEGVPAVDPNVLVLTPPDVAAVSKTVPPYVTPALGGPADPSVRTSLVAPSIAPVTGVQPTLRGATGATPALKGATGSQPPLRPLVTGSNPALVPTATGSQPPHKPGTAAPRPVATGSQPPGAPAFPGDAAKRGAAAKPSDGPAGGLTEQKIKAIYDAYLTAKRRCGEDTSTLSLNAVSETLKKQVPELMKQHKARSVEFKVVIKDGKAVLRALPKE